MNDNDTQRIYKEINNLWKLAKNDDAAARFCIDLAYYVYSLFIGDSNTDEYWSKACKGLDPLVKRYGDVDSKEAQWGRLVLQTAVSYSKGKRP